MVSITSSATCHFVGRNNFLFFFFCLLITGCSKEEIAKYSNVPEIQLVELSHDTIRQYEDILRIRIFYKDGNGDIGFESPEEYALFVRDIRLTSYDNFYIGPLAPPGVEVPIQGNLDIEFPSLFLFGNGTVEQTRFQIRMIDREGNESNVLETSTVAIIRE